MKIAVLAHALRVAGGLSVGKNLVAALSRIAPEHHYLFTIPAGVGYESLVAGFPRAEVSVRRDSGRSLRRLWYEAREVPRAVRRFHPDVVLALANRGLTGLSCAQAVLVQDSYLVYPWKHFGREWWPRLRVLPEVVARRWCLRRSLASTQLVFCQTDVVKRRMAARYGYAGTIRVCPNAVSAWTSTLDQSPVPPPLVPLAGRMKLFCLTRYYPHKNLEVLVDVFRRYASDLKDVVALITISAEQAPGAAKLLRTVQSLGLQEKIINVGPLEQGELADYFRHCQALLMPTLLESFSGTYLEAMQFGLPILTSDLDFAHAVCGDAAEYFDPWNPTSIRDAILKVKQDTRLARQLADKGTLRMKTIERSWDVVVQEMLEEVFRIVKERVDA